MNAVKTIFFSPFLPSRADNFPRFRDVVSVPPAMGDFGVLMRMGGSKLECQEESQEGCQCNAHRVMEYRKDPRFVNFVDDGDYLVAIVRVTDEDRVDYEHLINQQMSELSDQYKAKLRDLFKEDGPNTRALVELVCAAPPNLDVAE